MGQLIEYRKTGIPTSKIPAIVIIIIIFICSKFFDSLVHNATVLTSELLTVGKLGIMQENRIVRSLRCACGSLSVA